MPAMPPPESPRVVILHNFLPPHRVPLFEAIAERMNLAVWILGGIKSVREWDEPDASPKVSIQSLPRITLGLGSRYNAVLINYSLPRMLRRSKPDVLICCGWDTPAAFYAAWWARRTQTPFIVWSGSTRAEQTWLRRATAPLVRWYVRSAQAWIAYGTRAKEYLVDLGADAARVHRAFNTVDLAFYANASRLVATKAVRARWKLGDRRVVLFVGNLLELKGVFDLVRAFAEFSQSRDDVVLLLS
jgi:glycosyltransferase involved in cell wall biosynthesis